MNLAAGANSFVNIFDVNANGTARDDTLSVTGAISAADGVAIDLGNGEDTIVLNAKLRCICRGRCRAHQWQCRR
ncbi:hypothetical protein [Bradyrhizobium sp. LMG 9283]|uniref:hypothetical protein n=1 Tax=Bradyrhizobium sp. LMG 9283 TaxID=592064 RepID=UPI00388DED6E